MYRHAVSSKLPEGFSHWVNIHRTIINTQLGQIGHHSVSVMTDMQADTLP